MWSAQRVRLGEDSEKAERVHAAVQTEREKAV